MNFTTLEKKLAKKCAELRAKGDAGAFWNEIERIRDDYGKAAVDSATAAAGHLARYVLTGKLNEGKTGGGDDTPMDPPEVFARLSKATEGTNEMVAFLSAAGYFSTEAGRRTLTRMGDGKDGAANPLETIPTKTLLIVLLWAGHMPPAKMLPPLCFWKAEAACAFLLAVGGDKTEVNAFQRFQKDWKLARAKVTLVDSLQKTGGQWKVGWAGGW